MIPKPVGPHTAQWEGRPSTPCTDCAAARPQRRCGLSESAATPPVARIPLPSLSSASSLQCRRHHGSTQASLSFYGRKMNCLPSSGAERDDRTESCHLLWFWQQENRVFSPQPPLDGQCTPGIQWGKCKIPSPTAPRCTPSLPCLQKAMLFMNSIKPYFCGNVHFTKQGIKRLLVSCWRIQAEVPRTRFQSDCIRGTDSTSLHEDAGLELGREVTSLWRRGCSCAGPCLLLSSEGQESSHKLQINTFLGKTHPHSSRLGNKQQLVSWGLALLAFLSGDPQEQSRPSSSWENTLQKENQAILCKHIGVSEIKLIWVKEMKLIQHTFDWKTSLFKWVGEALIVTWFLPYLKHPRTTKTCWPGNCSKAAATQWRRVSFFCSSNAAPSNTTLLLLW